MKKKILLSLIVSFLIVSCIKLPSKEDESWYLGMVSMVKSYNMAYFEPPASVNDLIHYVELDNGSLIYEGAFESQYDFLKRYRDKIIIFTDNDIIFMYLKNKKSKNAIIGTSIETYCYYEKGMQGSRLFFDQNEDPILGESRNNLDEILKVKLRTIHYKSPVQKWQKQDGEPFEDVLIVEYTPENGLIDICSKSKIDLDSHQYYKQLYDCLKEFSEKYNLSRIIMDSYIPAE
jgi:hypothetical protein